ncbi:S-adenosyl-L-homocysteine hydrolase [Sedimentisphaera cyanobacteriorum]|uniref:S-adenosyl-L-homocysteine hydrolase n=1 Tax=Sedimentisphaera cyanobacteriorum TaxID=1940790 RepID=A0A1Q2HNQ2_9BACT|nr:NAD(P)-dependent oxidoreductase [Sedimentisphaera cyanobacteriorum]AQQ08843.1 S-adenosyl-L-homocysteine hydrolase [Sedimentisphaera cyanobacteriorum]
MPSSSDILIKQLESSYRSDEFVCLLSQYENWKTSQPLKGLRILEGSPVFRNTCPKIAALLAAGAEVTVGLHENCPYNPQVVGMLEDMGLEVRSGTDLKQDFDIILDCAGAYHQLDARLGFAELTKSGEYYYTNSSKPCFCVDSSIIKYFEDYLGTADGLMRSLEEKELPVSGKTYLVFGCGKVGAGICRRLTDEGAEVVLVEDESRKEQFEYPVIDFKDKGSVHEAAAEADFIVTVTGIKGVISKSYDADVFTSSRAFLINMGAEDEYGPDIPPYRVLNEKKPLNFILGEPTRLRYIDATLALHNYGAFVLQRSEFHSGLVSPPDDIERMLIKQTIAGSCISEEVKQFLETQNYSV